MESTLEGLVRAWKTKSEQLRVAVLYNLALNYIGIEMCAEVLELTPTEVLQYCTWFEETAKENI